MSMVEYRIEPMFDERTNTILVQLIPKGFRIKFIVGACTGAGTG